SRARSRGFRQLRPPANWATPVLCICARGDEAKTALDADDLAAKVAGGLTRATSGVLSTLVYLSKFAIFGGGLIFIAWLRLTWEHMDLLRFGIGLLSYLATCCIAVPVCGVTLLTRAILPGLGVWARETTKDVGYGRLARGAHTFLEVRSRRTP